MSPGLFLRFAPTMCAARGDALQYSIHAASAAVLVYVDMIAPSCASASGGTGMCTVSPLLSSSSLWMVTSLIRLEFFTVFQMSACSKRPQSSTTMIEFAMPPVPPLPTWFSSCRTEPGPSA